MRADLNFNAWIDWPRPVSPRTLRGTIATYREQTAGAALAEDVCNICASRGSCKAGNWLSFDPKTYSLRQREHIARLLSAKAAHDRIRRTPEERSQGFIGLPWELIQATGVPIPAGFIVATPDFQPSPVTVASPSGNRPVASGHTRVEALSSGSSSDASATGLRPDTTDDASSSGSDGSDSEELPVSAGNRSFPDVSLRSVGPGSSKSERMCNSRGERPRRRRS